MFYLVFLAPLAGIIIRSIVAAAGVRAFAGLDYFYYYIIALGLLIAVYFYRSHRWWRYVLLGAIFLLLGWWRMDFADRQLNNQSAIFNAGKASVSLSGTVVDEPAVSGQRVKYQFGFLRGENNAPLPGKLLVSVPLYPRLRFGDTYQFLCQLQPVAEISNVGYRMFLAKDQITGTCDYPQDLTAVSSESNLPWWFRAKKTILKIKSIFLEQVKLILPSPYSGLLSGLLVGGTADFPDDLKQAFVNAGVIHIVAISGYNISVIVGLFLTLAPYLLISRRWAWVVVVPALSVFVVLTGAESSVVRAALMGVVAAFAKMSGRLNVTRRALILTAALMVAINPHLLAFDLGFELSFLATVGITEVTPLLERLGERFWKKINTRSDIKAIPKSLISASHGITETLYTTIGANLAVLPILIFRFGRVSLISPLVNVLILWLIPWAMALGFFAVIVSFFFFPLGQALAALVWLILEYIIRVVELLGS